jgi:flagellar biosynthesis protein FliR
MGLDDGSLALLLLTLARLVPLALLATSLSRGVIPLPVALSLGLSLAVALVGPAAGGAVLTTASLVPLVVRELCLGLAFALASLLPIAAFAWSARFAEHALGSPLPRVGPVATLYGLLAGFAFFALSGHRALLSGLAVTLRDTPVGDAHLDAQGFALGVARYVGEAFAFAFAWSLPLLLSVWLAGVLFALSARALGVPTRAALRLPVLVVAGALMAAPLSARLTDALRKSLASAPAAVRDASR